MTALQTAFVMFPLLLPIWQATPLTSENTKIPDQDFFLEDSKLEVFYGYLNELKDPSVRHAVTSVFPLTSNKTAVKMLEARLGAEKDGNVFSESLASIYKLKKFGRPEKIGLYRDLMKNPSPHNRAYAGALYMLSGGGQGEVLGMLTAEKSEYVSGFLWEFYRENAKNPDTVKLLEFMPEGNTRSNRCGAARVLAASAKSLSDAAAIEKYCTDRDAALRNALAQGLADSQAPDAGLMGILSRDASNSVRALTASAFSAADDARKTIIALSADKDFEVRRLACITLGKYKDDDAVEALIRRFMDDSIYVRDAAEDSIVAIKPGDRHIKMIETDTLDDQVGRDSAVRVLGLLGRKEYSGKITDILSSTESDETKVRACGAISLLQHKEAWQAVSARAKDKTPRVRQAVAATLGRLNMKESYPTIAELINDKELIVKVEALKSAGLSGSDFFKAALLKDASDFRAETHTDIRSYSCWSLARIRCCDTSTVKLMETIVTKKIIPTMMGPVFDSMHTRTSAFWVLAEFGKTSDEAKKCAEKIFATYSKPPSPNSFDEGNPGMYFAYFKQAMTYMNGGVPEQEQMPLVEPEFPVNPYKKKDE